MKKNIPINYLLRIRLMLLTAGIFLIYLGVRRGEMMTVMQKAINICLECIGIG